MRFIFSDNFFEDLFFNGYNTHRAVMDAIN